ncbi:MAG: AAA family ATPase [Bacteroidota bacterium]
MAECNEVLNLVEKGENYENLYVDLQKLATDIIDSYHWLDHQEAFEASGPIKEIRNTASSAVDEYEKVVSIRKSTRNQVNNVLTEIDDLITKVNRETHHSLEIYVKNLTKLRELRGETESLKTLRYVNEAKVEQYETKLKEESERYADSCVRFLLRDDALKEYTSKVDELEPSIEKVGKVAEVNELEKSIDEIAQDLEMLIDIVSNLKISDATHTTQIIDNISALFSILNKNRASLKNKKRSLMLMEGKAEFNAQIKLIEQGITNYLDLSDTPKKCEEYLAKLMVQLEELEGKFAEFEDFVEKISDKREEAYNAFEAKKISLVEAKNKRANSLQQSANRILGAAQSRTERMTSVSEINGYFSSDLMIEKIRNIVAELKEIGDSVKADDIQSRVKSLKEDAIRQLRDKTELFADGEDIIKFGNYKFSVNTQTLEITIVPKDDDLYYHLAGTNFYEKIDDPRLSSNKNIWSQTLVSEGGDVYRSEYLAFKIIEAAGVAREENRQAEVLSLEELYRLGPEELLAYVQKFMALRYNEGYMKGVHDHDAAQILAALLRFYQSGDLLRFSAQTRTAATFFWKYLVDQQTKEKLNNRIKGIGIIQGIFPETKEYSSTLDELDHLINEALSNNLFELESTYSVAQYLFEELKDNDDFVKSSDAIKLKEAFLHYLAEKKANKKFESSLQQLKDSPVEKFKLTRQWLEAYVLSQSLSDLEDFIEEAALVIIDGNLLDRRIINVNMVENLDGLQGTHPVIEEGNYHINFNKYLAKIEKFQRERIPAYLEFHEAKKELIHQFTDDLRFEEFKPKVMSSFVRNKLINEVYLPLIGANLAKQIGEAGESKRTDLMGMLLLISPPGYGKTTLMEYLANRLGIIFMKINGPAIGHAVTSVDPAEAPNAAAREELNKLNLAFEMGDNVMIYVDDIQHCNPEFLQKFISLCDAQRKIEGVYKGKSKTYDFRGKKVCVVMAGNPYTESGEKFRIPDMLSNRADVYNLGDIIGSTEDVFNLSYLENCITSNSILNKLAGKSVKDIYTLISAAEKDSLEGAEFETNHSQEEVREYLEVFKKLFVIRDVITKVNQQYIKSAGQADEYRTEPPFKLQGSYRDMNKIAEKVFPVMNEEEMQVLIDSHYQNEAQTLTTGAEANLLKFAEINDGLETEQQKRWNEIKTIFMKHQKAKGYGAGNQMGQMMEQVEEIAKGLDGIRKALMKK